ncbi:hypothetical protein QFZ70_000318 [Arthrobacter sp. V1I9]|jgi:hypothetical protein|nr:hypothetical protein [Arthrobacter sp. V1I9]
MSLLLRAPWTSPAIVLRSGRRNNGVTESTLSYRSRAVASKCFSTTEQGDSGGSERLRALVGGEDIKELWTACPA